MVTNIAPRKIELKDEFKSFGSDLCQPMVLCVSLVRAAELKENATKN